MEPGADFPTTQSANGPTINLTAVYNSYNADGSRATVDHGDGIRLDPYLQYFSFSTQFGAMFRYDGTGRVTKYGLLGPGGTFVTAANGYFETLVKTLSNHDIHVDAQKTTPSTLS